MTELPPHIARPSRELVGPVEWFRGQPVAVTSSPPDNTLDPRYDACTDHHLACDCREAQLSEDMRELRDERWRLRQRLGTALADHPTRVYVNGHRRADLECRCLGCDLARSIRLIPHENIRHIGGIES
jgi:hypothetical protein